MPRIHHNFHVRIWQHYIWRPATSLISCCEATLYLALSACPNFLASLPCLFSLTPCCIWMTNYAKKYTYRFCSTSCIRSSESIQKGIHLESFLVNIVIAVGVLTYFNQFSIYKVNRSKQGKEVLLKLITYWSLKVLRNYCTESVLVFDRQRVRRKPYIGAALRHKNIDFLICNSNSFNFSPP